MSTLPFLAQLYLGKIQLGEISINDVPSGLREQVTAALEDNNDKNAGE